MKQLITVFGATGAQGAPVVDALRAAGYRVRGVARDAGRVRSLHGDDVEAVSADLADTAQVAAALRGVDGAFAHLPIATSPDAPARQLEALLTAAHAERLPQLVYSTSGPAGARYRASPLIAASTAAAEAVLGSGVPATVLVPQVYVDNLRADHAAQRLLASGVLDYPPVSRSRSLSWITHADQGRFAAAAFSRPELRGRLHEIASTPAMTGQELADLLSTWAGRCASSPCGRKRTASPSVKCSVRKSGL